MNTSLDIKKIYDLIDLYKYASVDGERVEIIVTPYEEETNTREQMLIREREWK